METLHRQFQYVGQALQCSATLEDVSPSMRICHLAIPWCGRQLHWQMLLPAPPQSAPDLLFDDDSFRPLCGPPRQPQTHFPSSPERPGSSGSQAILRSLLRGWSASPTTAAAAAAAAPAAAAQRHGPAAPHALPPLEPHPEGAPNRLLRLVSALLDAYREHQLARLAAAAAGLPRLQFELSTLELGPGVQLELQQQQHQACLALRLPALDMHPLLELAELYGAVLPPYLQRSMESAPGSKHPHPHHQPSPESGSRPVTGADGASEDAREARGVPSLLDRGSHGSPGHVSATGPVAPPPQQDHHHRSQQQQQPAEGAQEFTLLAGFRLPAVGGADVGDPELTLQLPRVLLELKAQDAGSSPGGPAAAGPATGGGAAAASAGSSGPSLVPSFMLPLWSPHMCLAEFVPMAVERLQAQLDAHCNTLAARQQLFEHLAELLGAPLELNLRGGTALFSLAWEGSSVLLTLELGPRFPTDKPAVVLQCLRVLPGAESSRAYRDYPWSPRWAPGEIAARIHNWLQEELPLFIRGRAPHP